MAGQSSWVAEQWAALGALLKPRRTSRPTLDVQARGMPVSADTLIRQSGLDISVYNIPKDEKALCISALLALIGSCFAEPVRIIDYGECRFRFPGKDSGGSRGDR